MVGLPLSSELYRHNLFHQFLTPQALAETYSIKNSTDALLRALSHPPLSSGFVILLLFINAFHPIYETIIQQFLVVHSFFQKMLYNISMNNKRKQLIYGNCEVYSPDGELMFRCMEKRIHWYLKRNLATIIRKDPWAIKLNFTPKGKGSTEAHLKSIRNNQCVVCGEENLEELTRHHIIPYEYRKYFPDDLKTHNAIYVIPLCRSCHETYERYADELKKHIEEKFNAPRQNNFQNYYHVEKHILTILRHKDVIPKHRLDDIKGMLTKYMADFGMNFCKSDCDDDEKLEFHLKNIQNTGYSKNNHAETVIKTCQDLDGFSKKWVTHFVETMKPKFMPDFLVEISKS